MIRLFLLCLCVPFFASEFENLSLETCIQKARVYYPLHKNTALLEQALNLSLDKINLTFVPRLKFTGKFTHQNEVTDARFLGVSSPLYEPIDKTQYQVAAELSLPIIDSGSAWANKALQRASNAVSKASVQNELYKVQESVINAFFSSLLFDEQLKQNEIYINDLQKDYENMLSRYKNGVALKDNVDKISIELLNAKQDKQNLQSQKDIANDTLSRLIGLKDFNLEIPSFENCKEELFKFEFDFENSRGNIFSKRPELDYFYLRKEEAQTQKKLELSKSLPYVDAFVQGGYGNPGLNMLKNGTDSFYIVGLRFTWDFSNLYSKYQQDELIRKEQLQIGSLEDEFYLNAKISLNSNIKTAKSLIFQLSQDDEIIALQEKIVLNSKAKFLNGVLSINDFLSDVNQFYIAKLQRSYRQIQFLSIIYQIKQLVNEWNLRN